jgi:hypothetical protein
MPFNRRRGFWLAACVAAALMAPAPASAQVPTLMGEHLVSTGEGFPFPPGGTAGEFTITGNCNPGGSSTFQFTATGPAVGPYPGTFEEHGTFTLVPDSNSVTGISLSDFQASFTIDAANGQVTGTKSFADLVPGAGPSCNPTNPYAAGSGASLTDYQARIRPTTGGSFTTEGQATGSNIFVSNEPGGPVSFSDFVEDFLTGSEPVSEGPTTKDQCTKGGFKDFPGFKNQGDCVAFLATGGKNEPGKNLPGVP